MGRPATLRVQIVGDAKGLKSSVDEADGAIGKLGRGLGKAGGVIGAGLAVAGTAVIGFGVSAVNAASDVQQSMGALETVFGSSAERVKEWAATAAQAVGLSEASYAELAAVTGSQLKNFGMSQDEAATKTQTLISLGADLSATFGGSVSEAVSAVGSLLRGETDPIERYGVSINAAKIEAELAAQGLSNLTGKAADQAKANAILTLLMGQTADAAGAFGRETNTLAHQQQVLGAQFENVKAKVGAQLLPVLTQAGMWMSEKGLPAVMRLGGGLKDTLGPAFTAVGGFVTGTVLPALARFNAFVEDRVVPVVRSTLTPVINGIKSAWSQFSTALSNNQTEINQVRSAAVTVGTKLGELWLLIQSKVLPVVGTALGTAFRAAGAALSVLVSAGAAVVRTIGSIAGAVERAIAAIGRLKATASSGLGKIGGLLGFSSSAITTGAPRLVGGGPELAGGINGLATAAAGDPAGFGGLGYSRGLAAPAGPAYVDQRRFDITIEGALDAPGVARQLRDLLTGEQFRQGTLPAFTGGLA